MKIIQKFHKKKMDDFFLKIIERNIIYIQPLILDGTTLSVFLALIIITTIFIGRKIEGLFIDKNLILENDNSFI